MIKDTLNKLAAGESLTGEEVGTFIDEVVAGNVTDAQTAAFLTALRVKGETVEEVAGCVQALQRHVVSVPHNQSLVFDCCGTGGDGKGSFNISTAAALIVAACGVPVAKHGNRAVSSSCGSADILETAGAKLELEPDKAGKLLDELNFCFLFAPIYHAATKKIALVRRDLGIRTIFNLIGPLLNPAVATHQMVGTSSESNAVLLAEVSGQIPGMNVRTLFNSHGFDELLPTGTNHVYSLADGQVTASTLPLPASIEDHCPVDAFSGGDPKENLAILNDIIDDKPSRTADACVLNAAYGLVTAGAESDIGDAVVRCRAAVADGAVKRLLADYVTASQEA